MFKKKIEIYNSSQCIKIYGMFYMENRFLLTVKKIIVLIYDFKLYLLLDKYFWKSVNI